MTASSVKKKSNLKIRVITAFILIPIVLLAIFFLHPLSFGVVSGFIILIAALEWPRLMGKTSYYEGLGFICVLIIFMIIGLAFIQFGRHLGLTSILLFCFITLFWVILSYCVYSYQIHKILIIKNEFLIALVGWIILTACWLSLNIIRNCVHGKFFIVYLLILVWGADTTAYFSGRRWGKAKLVPNVSPNKTWEGVWGALICSFILGVIAACSFPIDFLPRLALIPLSLIVCLFSIAGDLTVSIFKRQQNLKDTSALLPGHGGLLDRIDSLLAAAPIFALGLLLLGLQK